MKKISETYAAPIFFILTIFLSSSIWLFQIPGVSSYFNLQLHENYFWLGECAPGFSAILLTWIISGKNGIVALIKPAFFWRAKPIYYFIVIVVLAYFYLATIGLSTLQGAHPPGFLEMYQKIKTPFFNLQAIWLIPELTILYIFCEELGWRGFALPRLLKKYNAIYASIIIGLVWALFHVPLMVINAHPITFIYLLGYAFSTILSSFLFTWIYLRTNGSLFIVGLLHALIDTYGAFSPTIISDVGQGKNTSTILLYFIALLPVIFNLNTTQKIYSKNGVK